MRFTEEIMIDGLPGIASRAPAERSVKVCSRVHFRPAQRFR